MAEEDVAVALPSSDLKRKLEDVEPEAPRPPTCPAPEEPDAREATLIVEASASPDVKRPRLDDSSVASENGHQEKKADESSNGNTEPEQVQNGGAEDAETHPNDSENASDDQKSVAENNDSRESEPPSLETSQVNNVPETHKEEGDPTSDNVSNQGNVSTQQPVEPFAETATISRKIEVPNDKVGVLIGKGGDTVRFLQYNSGAKIQIVRDADADMACSMRPVELIGSLESISKAEKLIRDVISEADAGGSPALIARGFAAGQTAGAAEQFEMAVPNDKVGLIIGRGGDTIKGLQTRSGARIQLIPQQTGGGDESKERMIRITGNKRQIDIALEMIKDVMKQLPKPSHLSGGYHHQQAYQSRGGPPAHWGPPRGSPRSQPPLGYGYQPQRGGPYPSQNPQYPPPSYNPQAPPQMVPRHGGFGWDQRPPPPHGGNYYGFPGVGPGPNAQGPGPHAAGPPPPQASYNYGPPPTQGPPPPQANYSYGPPTQGPPPPEYGHSGPYSSQPVPAHHQGYGHSGYETAKYESAPPPHSSQPAYSQAPPQSGYYSQPQQQYGRPPATASYGMNTQYPPQPYGNPTGNQPSGGDAMTNYPPGSSSQLYGSQQQPGYPPSSYPAVSVPPPMQQQQTSYPAAYASDGQVQGQGQGGAAATYGSYPPPMQQQQAAAAGYPTAEQQATTYHHQAAPVAPASQDPNAAAAASYTQQQPQQHQAGYAQQQAYGGPLGAT